MVPFIAPIERYARLQWLIRLRWFALAGVSLAAGVAAAGLVPGLNVEVVAAAIGVGVLTNLFVAWRGRQRGDTDDRHVGQAVLDTGALTLVLWASAAPSARSSSSTSSPCCSPPCSAAGPRCGPPG
jgi:hypothetical protein